MINWIEKNATLFAFSGSNAILQFSANRETRQDWEQYN
jgi:hypothetical protein